ncbi:MAG TPA: HNH endonuclease [Egibacteraceae bacterium]|nr:HNH endonuclease [Egibacteraceae bacterium]
MQRQRPRLLTLGEIENDLRRLLEDFGPPRRRQQPHYPFWHLQSDGLWEVPEGARVARVTGRGSPPLRDLSPLAGGLPGPLYEQLRADPDLVMRLARRLLDEHFPSSVHCDILERVGLPDEGAAPAARDPGFRLRVLRAYEFRCAVCGYDGRLDATPVGLEAAHVQWWSHRGPDRVGNGLALCTLHHKAFDLGVIGLDERLRVQVSQAFHGGQRARELVIAYAGAPLRRPQPGQPEVAERHRGWHEAQVFRGPGRVLVDAAAESRDQPPYQ